MPKRKAASSSSSSSSSKSTKTANTTSNGGNLQIQDTVEAVEDNIDIELSELVTEYEDEEISGIENEVVILYQLQPVKLTKQSKKPKHVLNQHKKHSFEHSLIIGGYN